MFLLHFGMEGARNFEVPVETHQVQTFCISFSFFFFVNALVFLNKPYFYSFFDSEKTPSNVETL